MGEQQPIWLDWSKVQWNHNYVAVGSEGCASSFPNRPVQDNECNEWSSCAYDEKRDDFGVDLSDIFGIIEVTDWTQACWQRPQA